MLGTGRAGSAPFVVTDIDRTTNALFARSTLNRDFGARVAFADLAFGMQSQWTCDRTEFLGRHGRTDRPRALHRRGRLSQRTGAGYDPCAALQTALVIPAGGHHDVTLVLGEAATRDAAAALVATYRAANLDDALAAVTRRWDEILGTVQVTTPDRAMDLLLNRWLLYQTLACRLWARAAFYQASGAFGFRDQLQDVMALTMSRPDLAREQILRAATRQFEAGDVQHWWHPPSGRGVRTRISDDLLWLPYVAAHYVDVTGETAVLDAIVPFLDGPPLQAGQEESYFEPRAADHDACIVRPLCACHRPQPGDRPARPAADRDRRLERRDESRRHPRQRREATWLGWFLSSNSPTGAGPRSPNRAATASAWCGGGSMPLRCARRSTSEAWDGEWYRRAWFDDGTPLGSAANEECQIDSIAQSWSAIAATGDPARHGAARRWHRSTNGAWSGRTTGWSFCSRQPFDTA